MKINKYLQKQPQIVFTVAYLIPNKSSKSII